MKDCTTCKYGYEDERLGIPMCHHPNRFSEDCVDFNMHEEVEESEKATGIEGKKLPEGLDEAAEKSAALYYADGGYSPFPNIETAAHKAGFKAGAEWQKEQMMEEWLKDRDGCFWDGVEEGKKVMEEQMLKDAVKGVVCKDKKCVWIEFIPNALPDYEDIEPVKCVVMKED